MNTLTDKLDFLTNSFTRIDLGDVKKMDDDKVMIDFPFPMNSSMNKEATHLINIQQGLGNLEARFFSLKDKNRVMLTFKK